MFKGTLFAVRAYMCAFSECGRHHLCLLVSFISACEETLVQKMRAANHRSIHDIPLGCAPSIVNSGKINAVVSNVGMSHRHNHFPRYPCALLFLRRGDDPARVHGRHEHWEGKEILAWKLCALLCKTARFLTEVNRHHHCSQQAA